PGRRRERHLPGAPGRPLLRRRPDRERPARGLRGPQGRTGRRGRALAPAEPLLGGTRPLHPNPSLAWGILGRSGASRRLGFSIAYDTEERRRAGVRAER